MHWQGMNKDLEDRVTRRFAYYTKYIKSTENRKYTAKYQQDRVVPSFFLLLLQNMSPLSFVNAFVRVTWC